MMEPPETELMTETGVERGEGLQYARVHECRTVAPAGECECHSSPARVRDSRSVESEGGGGHKEVVDGGCKNPGNHDDEERRPQGGEPDQGGRLLTEDTPRRLERQDEAGGSDQ
jgi:hypothetical protein